MVMPDALILRQDLLAETSAHGPSSFIYQRRAA
jgi:hypothetical protein